VAYGDCGSLGLRGCSNLEAHPAGVDGRPPGVHYVQVYRRCCGRAECPTCYEVWASKEAKRAEHRIRAYKPVRYRSPVHVAVSVPSRLYGLEFVKLRVKARQIARKAGLVGGCSIFHPFRFDVESKASYWSPHFHILGYGWVVGTDRLYEDTGWVVRNKGVRRSVKATLSYLLSHAGVHKGRHTVTWWGALSYNKLSVAPLEPERHFCPMCGLELRPFLLAEGLDPPDQVGTYYLDDGRFVSWDL
jgi:hypothetical protein